MRIRFIILDRTDFGFANETFARRNASALESKRNREDAEAASYCVSIRITYLAYCTLAADVSYLIT